MDNAAMNQLVDVVVEHAYTASEDDELSLRPGDVVRAVERCPGGWWKGELHGRVGLFPDNFVRVIKNSHDNAADGTRNSGPRYCRAMFSYQQANPDELSLAVGDVIQVLGEEEEGWWRGQRGTLRGVFPSNFVVPIEATPALPVPPPTLPPKPVREQCRVLFPYTAANADELTLAEGDTVTIVTRDVPDQGWWRGELRGRIGLFPDNFVTVLPILPSTVSSGDTNSKKALKISKNISSNNQNKSQPISSNRKDSTSSRSSIGSAHENVASVRKSLEMTDNISTAEPGQKPRKSLEATEATDASKPRRSLDPDGNTEQKPRRSLEVDNGGIKPPVPAKKATSPVAAMFSGLRQKVKVGAQAMEHRLTGQPTNETVDGMAHSRSSGEPVLLAASPTPPAPSSPLPPNKATGDCFDQVERASMLNDPRAGRVKAPRRRPPSQALRDDLPLTNGSSPHSAPSDVVPENEIVKPKAREWEKNPAPWMEELKQKTEDRQSKKISPIAEIGRSKTIATTDSRSNEKPESQTGRHSENSDKILESTSMDGDKESGNPLEMSQSMTAISSKAIKIDTSEEIQRHTENPLDMSKSMSSIASKASHHETNNKISANELRTSISTSESVVLRCVTTPHIVSGATISNSQPTPVPVVRPHSGHVPTSRLSGTPLSDQIIPTIKNTTADNIRSSVALPRNEKELSSKSYKVNDDVLYANGTPEQLLIAQLNERVANLEKVVEAQEERFSAALASLSEKLTQETRLRAGLQDQLLKHLECCVTRV